METIIVNLEINLILNFVYFANSNKLREEIKKIIDYLVIYI